MHGVKLFRADQDVGVFIELLLIVTFETKCPLIVWALLFNTDQ